MNIHIHPSEWFHHGHAEQAHPRQVSHNATVWSVIIVFAVLAALTALMLIMGPPEAPHTPYLPTFPF